MRPEEATAHYPLSSRMCADRGCHRRSGRTPGECGDCGVDIPVPPRPVLLVNDDSPGDWLDVRPPDRAVLHIDDLPIVERDDIGTPTPTVSPLRVGDTVELATWPKACPLADPTDCNGEHCDCPMTSFAKAIVERIDPSADATLPIEEQTPWWFVTLVDIEALP